MVPLVAEQRAPDASDEATVGVNLRAGSRNPFWRLPVTSGALKSSPARRNGQRAPNTPFTSSRNEAWLPGRL